MAAAPGGQSAAANAIGPRSHFGYRLHVPDGFHEGLLRFERQGRQVAIVEVGQGLEGEQQVEAKAADCPGARQAFREGEPGAKQRMDAEVILRLGTLIDRIDFRGQQVAQTGHAQVVVRAATGWLHLAQMLPAEE